MNDARTRFLLLAALLLAAGCSSTQPGDQAQPQQAQPQRTWRDDARECYEAAAQGAQTRIWRGRTGIAACDLYVEDMRYEEARADADYRARLNYLQQLQLQQEQQWQQLQQQQLQEQEQRRQQLQQQQRPRQPVDCYTYYIGSTAHTRCQ